MSTPTLSILTAVDAIIDTAREREPSIPEVVVVLGSKGRTKSTQVHGYFDPRSWKQEEDVIHEIMLSGESLARGAKSTLGTILHEITHAYCHANEIMETSNRGRYHNSKFREVAENVFGLKITKKPTIGWSSTELAPDTEKLWESELEWLGTVLTAHRLVKVENSADSSAKKFVMLCESCGDKIQTTKSWFERNEHRLGCFEHQQPFVFRVEGGE